MEDTDGIDDDELLDYAIQMSIQESCGKATIAGSPESHRILEAIERGDLNLLQELSDVPAAFQEADNRGWYPLHKAALQASPQVLEMVLHASYRLSLEVKTDDGETALILATTAGFLANVLILLEHGAAPDGVNSNNETPLLLAVRMDLLDVALLLISRGASVNYHCQKKWTAVHEAAKMGYTDILKMLIAHGGNISETDQHGVTAMAIAAEYGQTDILEILIKKGGDVNAQAPNGDTVLYDAAGSGNPDCIELLLQHGANPNVPSLSSQLPIHRAAYEGHYLALRILIPITTRRALRLCGQSPIHSAANGGHVQCLELLVEKGFNVNAVLAPHISENYGDMRRTALYFAVSNGDITCTEMLLNAGAKPDLDPLSCLLVAVRAGRYEIVRMLLAKKADVNCYFSIVCDTVFPSVLQYCLRDETMMRILLNSGYDVKKCFHCHHDTAMTEDSDSNPDGNVPFCDFISVSWIEHLAGSVVTVLLDYVSNVSICPKLKATLEKYKEWSNICDVTGSPRSLRHLCRLVIRGQITYQRLADPNTINMIFLPQRLKDYLIYKEEHDYEDIEYSTKWN